MSEETTFRGIPAGSVADNGHSCMLPALWTAARDAWPFGTGAGLFDAFLLAYRDQSCGMRGISNRAPYVFIKGSVTLGLAFWIMVALALAALLPVLVRRC